MLPFDTTPIAAVKTPTLIPIKGDKEFNDFAIFILKYPAVYSKVVRPICLPQQYEESYNKKATVVGWGMFKTGSKLSPFLKKVELKISPPEDDQCKLISTIISKNKNGEPQDPCSGDSGNEKRGSHIFKKMIYFLTISNYFVVSSSLSFTRL